jgi:hypothetical protein
LKKCCELQQVIRRKLRKNYFDVALKTSDYYTKDVGTWGGKGAEILGLKDNVERKDFVALANNRWPGANGKRLTARMNKTRLEDVIDKKTGVPAIDPETGAVKKREVSNRRAGYDFTFSVPKSVSLYLAVNEDKVVEQTITEAVDRDFGGDRGPDGNEGSQRLSARQSL